MANNDKKNFINNPNSNYNGFIGVVSVVTVVATTILSFDKLLRAADKFISKK